MKDYTRIKIAIIMLSVGMYSPSLWYKLYHTCTIVQRLCSDHNVSLLHTKHAMLDVECIKCCQPMIVTHMICIFRWFEIQPLSHKIQPYEYVNTECSRPPFFFAYWHERVQMSCDSLSCQRFVHLTCCSVLTHLYMYYLYFNQDLLAKKDNKEQ